LLKLNS